MTTRSSLDRSAWASMALVVASDTARRRSSMRSSRKVGLDRGGGRHDLTGQAHVLGSGRDLEHDLTHRRTSERSPRAASAAGTVSCISMISSSRVNVEQGLHPRDGSGHHQVAAVAAHPLQGADDHAEPDRVDEIDPREVEHDPRVALAHQADHLLAQPGGGGQLELAGHRDHGPGAAEGDVEREQHAPSLADGRQPRDAPSCTAVTTPAKPVHLCDLPIHRLPSGIWDRHGARHRHRPRRPDPRAGRRPAPGPPRAPARPRGPLRRPDPAPAPGGGRAPAGRAALEPPGRGHRPGPRRAVGRRRHGHGLGQVALLPGPRSPRRPPRRSDRRGALLLFPTKALAQDQLRSLTALAVPGPDRRDLRRRHRDAPSARWVRANANVVLTNPEMLHHGVLPHHDRWATFLMRLEYVVVDELHVLRGVFGTHVAHLLRRLRRLCAHYGSHPTFIFSSATIGQPGRLASELCGLDVTEITDDGSPHGERLFVLWNPGVELPPDAGSVADDAATPSRIARRPSASRETARVMAELIRRGHRTIAFCRSRKGTELVAADVRRRLPADLADRVRPYRGGYLAAERREIELELFGGSLRGVVATTALELGIDVGGLDACVLDGFPGTIASMWQQAGRAGREAQESIVVLVAGDDQLDQWLMGHPDQVFSPPARARRHQPGQPVRARRPSGLRRLRTAPQPRRRAVVARAARRRRPPPGARRPPQGPRPASARRCRAHGRLGRAGLAVPRRRAAQRLEPRDPHRPRRRHADRHGRPGSGLPPGAPRSDLPAPGPELPGGPRSISTTVRPSSSRPTAASGPSRAAPPTSPSWAPIRSARWAAAACRSGGSRFGPRSSATAGSTPSPASCWPPRSCSCLPASSITRAFWYTVEPRTCWPTPAWPRPRCPARSMPSSTRPSACSRCSRSATAGTSAACRPPLQAETGQPTIVIYDGYPGGAGIAELGYANADRHLAATLEVIESCPLRRRAARRACSHPSAATATNRSTSPERSRCSGPAGRRGRRARHHSRRMTTRADTSTSGDQRADQGKVGRRRGTRARPRPDRPRRRDG